MWFLIRAAFWFSLVLLMLPFGSDENGNQVSPLQALLAARAAVDDFSGICERKPEVCDTGKAALHTIGVRAKASAKLAYDMLGDETNETVVPAKRPGAPQADVTIKTGTVAPAASNGAS
ncbi:DUF5330 domain-containing protein [Mesorhizobium sp. BAC0120]|uniref:DUF5330 domain-containing protein n=1 Tax=Mesorhizobium sp. BAC0120 TaxID=3090670 RepID=UPI00298C4746|nr:DUF5330 domain-containing protein [Mesorhizobium sp. BAC0120]MDW6021070.1 DUF5330 domain-containing protein [Mesorhizobium sp. BAC0120]